MRFLRRPRPATRSIAVFCGAFHPPTVAHVELARAAHQVVEEVLWVMPETFPHKVYEGVSLPCRLRLVLEATTDPVAVASENLFFSIAREAQQLLTAQVKILAGEDGARRVVDWDYGLSAEDHKRFLHSHLQQFPVLTARRQQDWELPAELADCFEWLSLNPEVSNVSSSMVRELMLRGSDWKNYIPASIVPRVLEIYGSAGIVRGQ